MVEFIHRDFSGKNLYFIYNFIYKSITSSKEWIKFCLIKITVEFSIKSNK